MTLSCRKRFCNFVVTMGCNVCLKMKLYWKNVYISVRDFDVVQRYGWFKFRLQFFIYNCIFSHQANKILYNRCVNRKKNIFRYRYSLSMNGRLLIDKNNEENIEILQNCGFISFFKIKLHFFIEFFFFHYIFDEQVIIIRSDICNISMEFLGERKFVHHWIGRGGCWPSLRLWTS